MHPACSLFNETIFFIQTTYVHRYKQAYLLVRTYTPTESAVSYYYMYIFAPKRPAPKRPCAKTGRRKTGRAKTAAPKRPDPLHCPLKA